MSGYFQTDENSTTQVAEFPDNSLPGFCYCVNILLYDMVITTNELVLLHY
jgi:hypothetical protein